VDLVERNPSIDEILEAFRDALGPAKVAYRGHVYRVFNCARWLLGTDAEDSSLAIASAFHDVGIWSDRTFDYLAPSIARAEAYLEAASAARPSSSASAATVARIIAQHHRLRRVRGPSPAPLIEAFRLADRVDVSRGWLRAGLSRERLRELVTVFPYAGFHGELVRVACAWFLRHPLRPLPMLRL
jgi:hypothetical protein